MHAHSFIHLFIVSLQGKLESMDLVGSQTLCAPILPQNSWQSLKRSFISISTWLARGVWRSRLRSNWTRLRWRFGSKIAVWNKRNAKRKVFCPNLRPNWRMVSKKPRMHPKSRSPLHPRPLPLPRLLMPTPRIKRLSRLFCQPVIAELLVTLVSKSLSKSSCDIQCHTETIAQLCLDPDHFDYSVYLPVLLCVIVKWLLIVLGTLSST